MKDDTVTASHMPDHFDRTTGALEGIATFTEPSTIVHTTPMLGLVQTYIVRTARQREVGDTVFITYVDGTQSIRLVLPPRVTIAIARQRDALTSRVRRNISRQTAAERKAAGLAPAFMKNPGRGGRRRRKKRAKK